MDTSETYIKMCEKAEEIQEDKISPFHYAESDYDIFISLPYDEVWIYLGFSTHNPKRIWLPRQDQLQEMIIEKDSLYRFIGLFHDFAMNVFYDSTRSSKKWLARSMEQLWLAFVMKDKFNKTWSGEDWE